MLVRIDESIGLEFIEIQEDALPSQTSEIVSEAKVTITDIISVSEDTSINDDSGNKSSFMMN